MCGQITDKIFWMTMDRQIEEWFIPQKKLIRANIYLVPQIKYQPLALRMHF